MGLIEVLIVLAVIVGIVGGIAIHPLLFVVLLAALVLLAMRGGLGGHRV
jgi:hypothetical protein